LRICNPNVFPATEWEKFLKTIKPGITRIYIDLATKPGVNSRMKERYDALVRAAARRDPDGVIQEVKSNEHFESIGDMNFLGIGLPSHNKGKPFHFLLVNRVRTYRKFKGYEKFVVRPSYGFFDSLLKGYPKFRRNWQDLFDFPFPDKPQIEKEAGKPVDKESGEEYVRAFLSSFDLTESGFGMLTQKSRIWGTHNEQFIMHYDLGYILHKPQEINCEVVAHAPRITFDDGTSEKQKIIYGVNCASLNLYLCSQIVNWFYGKKRQLQIASRRRIKNYLNKDKRELRTLNHFIGGKDDYRDLR
jgi:hypothetical protein